ncbi:phage tail protein I [Methylobacterium aquaticum]|uniref:Phage tail protein I n=1 Tax=Methylobacterium aquaticum TaxID=270351 RepID=A0A0C6FTI9_9HYPH|nr:phage tail protein I [Methylobacterium aquaticum]BAQ50417.1 phage tail protein I [Methylobacterium aquaticum]
MADPVKRPTLLPSHATPREAAHAAVEARLDDRAAQAAAIAALKDPATCPATYLPYLAWERSVDVYDPAWPEDVRRAVIAAAPLVHALKGTPAAVKAVLAALKIDATVTEWWETTPRGRPYTFSVTAFARARLYGGAVLDARLVRVAYQSVMAVKPLSRAFDLTLAAEMPGRVGLAPVGLARSVLRLPAVSPPTDEAFAASLGAGGVALARARVAVSFASA